MPNLSLKQPLPIQDLEFKEDDESIKSKESDKTDASVNLNTSNNKNLFLTKIGITFIVYSLVCLGTAIFILIDIQRTTIVYRSWSLQTVLWVFMSTSIVIKLGFGFLGQKIRKLVKLFFVLDLFATVMFVMGIYYWLDSFKVVNNYSYAPFVVIACINLFCTSFFFTLSTLYHSKSKEYNWILGTIFMTVFNVIAITGLAFGWKQIVTITFWQYCWVGFVFLFINLYLAVNSYYLVNVRADKFTEGDAVWAFYCYWTDVFYIFWGNLFSDTKHAIRHQKRKFKRAALAKAKTTKNTKKIPTDKSKLKKKEAVEIKVKTKTQNEIKRENLAQELVSDRTVENVVVNIV